MTAFLPHPPSYTAYAFTEPGDARLQKITVPWRDPEDNHIVVKVLASGVCGRYEAFLSYMHRFGTVLIALHNSDEQVVSGAYPIKYPRIPGHEIIGDVVAIPPGEKVWKLGQRVGGGWHGGHCHTCSRCRLGDHVTCEQQDINGMWY